MEPCSRCGASGQNGCPMDAGAACPLGARSRPSEVAGRAVAAVPPIRVGLPSDPVLRLALIRAGVITPQDIEKVEEELRATGIASSNTG